MTATNNNLDLHTEFRTLAARLEDFRRQLAATTDKIADNINRPTWTTLHVVLGTLEEAGTAINGELEDLQDRMPLCEVCCEPCNQFGECDDCMNAERDRPEEGR